MAQVRGSAVVRRVKEPAKGQDGLSIVWKGELESAPANPQKNWVYRNIYNKVVYIFNGEIWTILTKDGNDGIDGTDGSDGMSVFVTYHDNSPTSPPARPTGYGVSGGWHTDFTSTVVWMSQKVGIDAFLGQWGDPMCLKGANGSNGAPGPYLVFRGDYDSTAIYYGNSQRLDAVRYNNKVYRAKNTAGSFQNVVPTNTSKWEAASDQFEFVATKLLLADAAAIQNLTARRLKTGVSGARIELNADDTNEIAIFDSNGVLRNLIKPSAIPSISTIEGGTNTVNLSLTSSEMYYQSLNWQHPNFGSWQGSQVSASFIVSSPFESDAVLEIEVGNLVISAAVSNGLYARGMSSVTICLQKSIAGVWTDIGVIGSTNDMTGYKTITNTIRGLSIGTYRLIAYHSHQSYTIYTGYDQIADAVTTESYWAYASGQSSIAVTVRKVIEQTVQGSNGFCTVWASNKYAHMSSDGFFFRFGNYRLEIGANGVKINGVIHT